MKKISFLFLFLLLGCAPTKVAYDYNTKVDFKRYKTFSFFEDVGAGFNNLDVNRLLPIIENQLIEQGFSKAEYSSFYINFSVQKKVLPKSSSLSVGFGNSGRHVGVGIGGDIPIGNKKVQEKITLDFIDSKTDKLFWQAVYTATIRENIHPQERVVYFKKLIKKMLRAYPPEK